MASTSGLRARVRAQITEQIKDEARRQMAGGGAAGLSLRAVARELDMPSSGIYRYFASRDELLTALLVDAFDALAAAVEAADASCDRTDLLGRWRAGSHAVRDWALAHPPEFALAYGSPVPGYVAPQDTVGPATRVTDALSAVLVDAAAAGELQAPFAPGRHPGMTRAALTQGRQLAAALPGLPADVVMRALTSWTQLLGFVSFELFGHLAGVVDDPAVAFEQSIIDMAVFVGLPVTPGSVRRSRRARQPASKDAG